MTDMLAMCSFALLMSITPGPVNAITLFSGVRNGIGRTIPFVSGATAGFTALLMCVGIGAGKVFQEYPIAETVLRYLGTGFLLYVSYKIFTARGGVQAHCQDVAIPRFWEGVILQWSNPKAWAACVSGVALFVANGDQATMALFTAIYFVICFIGVGAWAVLGARIQHVLQGDRALSGFNRGMGIGLAALSLYLFFS